MIFERNINILKNEFPGIDWNGMVEYRAAEHALGINVVASKIGLPTLVLEKEGKTQYLHSKYNPIEEAERVAEQFKELENGKHILFFGAGLGYLIHVVMKKYPDSTFSIYEPSLEIFYNFISQVSLSDAPYNRLSNIFIGDYFVNEDVVKYSFFKSLSNNTDFMHLPIYKQIFSDAYAKFSEEFIQAIKSKGFDIRTRFAFEKLWMDNFVRNFRSVLYTENILNVDKRFFKDKPAILVSAGPSLEEEIENLKYIKENKLAYIFSVGSAIKALLNNGIYPDAICAIDGMPLNYEIYSRLINDPDNNTPLIFGSSLYHNVVDDYNAQKFHLFIDADPIAAYYLKYKNDDAVGKVGIAPSVAITTLELLYKLELSLIILVGQNFAYKNNNYYSNSIEGYIIRSTNMDDKDKAEAFEVESVTGGSVLTSPSLSVMRTQMELLIERSGMTNVINTTSGGAKIKGTTYESLSDIIKNRLKDVSITDEWTNSPVESYDRDYLITQHNKLKEERAKLNSIFNDFSDLVDKLSKVNNNKKEKTINNMLNDFGKAFSKLVRNSFYEVFIAKISSVDQDLLLRDLEVIKGEANLVKKSNRVGKLFKGFIEEYKTYLNFTDELFKEMDNTINEFIKIHG